MVSFLKKNNKSVISDQYYLSSLLPYDKRTKTRASLRTGLNEYLSLIYGSLKATNALEINALEEFDALVGENACQIRAALISIIVSKKEISFSRLRSKLNRLKDKICRLLEEKTISKLMNAGVSLEELCNTENLFVPLSFQETFIIQCYFLREVKSFSYEGTSIDRLLIKEKCIPKKLKKFGSISSSFADNLVSKLRKITAKQSVQVVREYAKLSKDEGLIKMLSEEFTVNHNNHLLCTPMFWTYKAVLFAAKLEKVKIVLHVKLLTNNGSYLEVFDECWFDSEFVSDLNGIRIEWSIKEMDWNQVGKTPCVVFQGVSCSNDDMAFSIGKWTSDFLRFPLSTIILSGAADHRQYPNEEDNNQLSQFLQDHEHETYKSLSKEEGFSFENPSRFFIQHVYASNTERLMSKTISFV